MTTEEKAAFNSLLERVREICDTSPAPAERLESVCELLKENLPGYDWVGIYLVDESKNELVLGPFAGEPTEHVRIPFGRGICGQAAESLSTVVVDDVTKETNYLSCSADVRSEIVLPIFKDGRFAGELDIDSHRPANFDKGDREFLESVCEMLSGLV